MTRGTGKDQIPGRADGCEWLREGVLEELAGRVEKLPVLIINRATAYALGHSKAGRGAGKPLVYFQRKPHESDPQFLAEFEREYVASVCALGEVGDVYLLRPFPEMEVNVPRFKGAERLFGRDVEVKLSVAKYHERPAFTRRIQDEAVRRCRARVLGPLPYLCDDIYCFGSENGRPLYVDDDHLSERGNRKLVPMFRRALNSNGTLRLQPETEVGDAPL